MGAVCLLAMACNGHVENRAGANPAGCDHEQHVGREILLSTQSEPLEVLLQPGEVFLTFDDGPHRTRTPRVLERLANLCIKAGFFLRGDNAETYSDLVRRIAAEGHTVGSHTYTHPRLLELSPYAATQEIIRGQKSISETLASDWSADAVRLFRFPYLESNETLNQIVDDLGLINVGANASGHDWRDLPSETVLQTIESALSANGRRGIVLLHDPSANSDQNLEIVIDALKASGYKFVSIKVADELGRGDLL